MRRVAHGPLRNIEARVCLALPFDGYGAESFGTLASGCFRSKSDVALKCARDAVDKRFVTEGVRQITW